MGVIEDVKERLDITDVVSSYVDLQKAGRNLKGLCPFHAEKTPSFIVTPDRQSWRCFGACAVGGDLFSFVMHKEGVGFGEALRLLAIRAGVELSAREQTGVDDLYRINQLATSFFREALESPEGGRALEYLKRRGVDDQTRNLFALGYSPNKPDSLQSHLAFHGVTRDLAFNVGLIQRFEDGGTRDFFRGRLMFPICDNRGRVTGFGARALDDGMPKYINTPSTSIFEKRGILYGLDLARGSIRHSNRGVIVEGYMDVIAAHQHGFSNVIASMGTALTEQQVGLLKPLASSFVLALDPDMAGHEATLRSLESAWKVFLNPATNLSRRSMGMLYQRSGVSLEIAALPQGLDPFDVISKDPNDWNRVISEAAPLLDFIIPAVIGRYDISVPGAKGSVVDMLSPLITSLDSIDQDHYINFLAEHLKVNSQTLRRRIGRSFQRTILERSNTKLIRHTADVEQPPVDGGKDALEEYILALLLSQPSLKHCLRPSDLDCFHNGGDKEIINRWYICSTIDELKETLDESLHDRIASLEGKVITGLDIKSREAAMMQCLNRLRRRRLGEMQENLLASEDYSVPPSRDVEESIAAVNAGIRETL